MKDFKKYYIIPATPDEVYQALTNPISIKLWSGEEAVMSTVPGSEFSLWEGSIVGKNIEFIEGKRITQQWYFGDDAQEESIVTILLHQHEKGTSVELKHSNIPDSDYKDIVEGWNLAYFAAVYDFFAD